MTRIASTFQICIKLLVDMASPNQLKILFKGGILHTHNENDHAVRSTQGIRSAHRKGNMEGIDCGKGEEYAMHLYHCDREGLLEGQRGEDRSREIVGCFLWVCIIRSKCSARDRVDHMRLVFGQKRKAPSIRNAE